MYTIVAILLGLLACCLGQDTRASRADCEPGQWYGHLHGGVSYLRWKAEQDGLCIALASPVPISLQNVASLNVNQNLRMLEPHFRSSSGVRLDVGYQCNEQWDTGLTWTHLHHNRITTFPQAAQYMYVVPRASIFNYATQNAAISAVSTNAQGAWRLSFDTIAWETKRLCASCDAWDFAPTIGIIGARVHQALVSVFNDVGVVDGGFTGNIANIIANVGDLTTQACNNFGGVGIICGAEAHGSLHHGIGMNALCKAALIAGSVHANTQARALFYGTSISFFLPAVASIPFHLHRLRAMVQMELGLDYTWSAPYIGDIMFSAAFEAQYWPNQFVASNGPNLYLLAPPARSGADLMFYGLTVQWSVAV